MCVYVVGSEFVSITLISPFFKKKKKKKKGCEKTICEEHGWGDGITDCDWEGYEYRSRKCVECENRFCVNHFYKRMTKCDVCSNMQNAQVI